mmetsp:Transcript_91714/g.179715  ORF Transcript_91714/g.179715 Transcript_91714/m.179715 type:complete len:80 (+) Transcript_91714:58-297(+)
MYHDLKVKLRHMLLKLIRLLEIRSPIGIIPYLLRLVELLLNVRLYMLIVIVVHTLPSELNALPQVSPRALLVCVPDQIN